MNGSEANAILVGSVPEHAVSVKSSVNTGSWLQLGLTKSFEWNHLELTVPHLHPRLHSFRILHLSDMHLTAGWSSGYDTLIARLRDDPPDLIAITGDLVDHKLDSRPALATLERLVTQLTSRLGIYAITGNHDGDLVSAHLPRLGVHFISRRLVQLAGSSIAENRAGSHDSAFGHDAAVLELIGLPGVKRFDLDPNWIAHLPTRRAGVPRIVLGHYPDQCRFIHPLQPDALLVGHTHGGQICLPNGHALMTHDKLPRRMARGIHRVGNTLLVVNRGFGTSTWHLRLFCPAEVIELRLTAAAGQPQQDR